MSTVRPHSSSDSYSYSDLDERNSSSSGQLTEWAGTLSKVLNDGDMPALKKITEYRPLSLNKFKKANLSIKGAELSIAHKNHIIARQAEHLDKLVQMYSFAKCSDCKPYSEPVLANIEIQLYDLLPTQNEEAIQKLFETYKCYHVTLPLLYKIVDSRVDRVERSRKEIKSSFCSTASMPGYFALDY